MTNRPIEWLSDSTGQPLNAAGWVARQHVQQIDLTSELTPRRSYAPKRALGASRHKGAVDLRRAEDSRGAAQGVSPTREFTNVAGNEALPIETWLPSETDLRR
jgi:hypothetical protein